MLLLLKRYDFIMQCYVYFTYAAENYCHMYVLRLIMYVKCFIYYIGHYIKLVYYFIAITSSNTSELPEWRKMFQLSESHVIKNNRLTDRAMIFDFLTSPIKKLSYQQHTYKSNNVILILIISDINTNFS